ncbi:MAG: hypothetical protein IKF07_08565 [Eubacterium sp.]|nr:hypothetical protein [Eubacterium sp.]
MEDKKTDWRYRVIRWWVRLLSPHYELSGTENLPEEPCVIVGNHCQIYGPIAAELYTPGRHATWCDGEVLDRKETVEYANRNFWVMKPKETLWFYNIISHMIGPLCELIFNNANTIGVYRDTRLISTYRKSISLLQNGSSIIIFPECYDEYNNIVYRFQDRFIDLARFYYKKTQKELDFVPMYLAPYLKKMCYGKPIRFDAEAPIEEERERISKALMDSITEMAVSLPPHTVVPYPNISRRLYPKSIPLEEYNDKKEGI